MLADLDIQGYHDKADDPERLLLWVDVALKTQRLIHNLRERERLQGELVANVSHEFRTPVNIIGGYAELLRAGDFGAIPETAAQPLDSILEATRGLGDLVTDFLSYARLDAGVMEVARVTLQTAELAHELERLGHLLVDEKDVTFTVDATEAPPLLVSDPVKLRTILRNLIANAAKFTARGTVSLRIALAGDALRFAVEDTGCGIPPEDLALIFEPFRQRDGSWTREHGGVGLGLAVAQRMASLLGGTLAVESQVGVGSRFTLVLPRLTAGETAHASGTGSQAEWSGPAAL
jgi:signal transduction histidine kinase